MCFSAIMLLAVQVMNATFMPVVVSAGDPAYNDRHVFDVLFDDLVVGYSLGTAPRRTSHDMGRLRSARNVRAANLRRRAAEYLDCVAGAGRASTASRRR